MTLDDLEGLFRNARQGTRAWDGTRWVGEYGGDRAGIRAVVEALRDEFGRIMYHGDYWNLAGIVGVFNDILGGAGEKAALGGAPFASVNAAAKAAGGFTRKDEHQADAGTLSPQGVAAKPAADPSKKEWRPVCVWREVHEWWNRSCDGLDVGFYAKPDNTVCGSCLKPIVFKEATK